MIGSLAASLILTWSFLSSTVFSLSWRNHLYFRYWAFLHTSLTVAHTHHNLRFPFAPLLQCHTCCPFTNFCFFNTKCASAYLLLWLASSMTFFYLTGIKKCFYFVYPLLYVIEAIVRAATQIWKFNFEKVNLKVGFLVTHLVWVHFKLITFPVRVRHAPEVSKGRISSKWEKH